MKHLLNFKAQFAPAVEAGTKRQTIRALRKRPIHAADTLRLYSGLRTRNTRLLREAVASAVIPITLDADGVLLRSRRLSEARAQQMAAEDGFQSLAEMLAWFDDVHGLPFSGVLIQWGKSQQGGEDHAD